MRVSSYCLTNQPSRTATSAPTMTTASAKVMRGLTRLVSRACPTSAATLNLRDRRRGPVGERERFLDGAAKQDEHDADDDGRVERGDEDRRPGTVAKPADGDHPLQPIEDAVEQRGQGDE